MALTPQQQKFKTVAKAANAKCHRETSSVAAYKVCMSTAMKAGLRKKRAAAGKRKRKSRKGRR